jgi:hypothetical protein
MAPPPQTATFTVTPNVLQSSLHRGVSRAASPTLIE